MFYPFTPLIENHIIMAQKKEDPPFWVEQESLFEANLNEVAAYFDPSNTQRWHEGRVRKLLCKKAEQHLDSLLDKPAEHLLDPELSGQVAQLLLMYLLIEGQPTQRRKEALMGALALLCQTESIKGKDLLKGLTDLSDKVSQYADFTCPWQWNYFIRWQPCLFVTKKFLEQLNFRSPSNTVLSSLESHFLIATHLSYQRLCNNLQERKEVLSSIASVGVTEADKATVQFWQGYYDTLSKFAQDYALQSLEALPSCPDDSLSSFIDAFQALAPSAREELDTLLNSALKYEAEQREKEKKAYIQRNCDTSDSTSLEDHKLEYKTSFFVAPTDAKEQNQPKTIMRVLCGFMNAYGGTLCLGIQDWGRVQERNDRRGIEVDMLNVPDRFQVEVNDKDGYWRCILDHYIKPTFPKEYKDTIQHRFTENNTVLEIMVTPCPYTVARVDGIAYKRVSSETIRMEKEEVEKLQAERLLPHNIDEASKVLKLKEGMERRVVVRLKNYVSSHSSTIADRDVEAYEFSQDRQYVFAYEGGEVKGIRQFKVSRMESVELTEKAWQHMAEYKEVKTDVFNMSGIDNYPISILLDLLAYNLLKEEYPRAKDSCQLEPDEDEKSWYRLTTTVYGWKGVVRFCMGLFDDIIIEPSDAEGNAALLEKMKENACSILNIDKHELTELKNKRSAISQPKVTEQTKITPSHKPITVKKKSKKHRR